MDDEGRIDVRGLVLRMTAAVVFLMALGAAGGWLFEAWLGDLADGFVARFGGPGVAFGVFLSDAFAFPVPPDIYLALAWLGGMPAWAIVLWGSAGSLVGGLVGFSLARQLARVPWARRRLDRRHDEVHAVLARYGVRALALAAVTPLPYGVMAWACAVLGMPLRTFLLVSLLRVPRIAAYLGLVIAGFVTVSR